jgi:RimJ/RimL family protein N-acetyltransferase
MTVNNIWKGKIVQLRNLRPEDADIVAGLPHESESISFAGGIVEFPRGSAEPIRNFFANVSQRNQEIEINGGNVRLAIEPLLEPRWVGTVGLHDSNMRLKMGTLDVWVSPSYEQGQGYGGDATLIMLNYAFNELGFQRVGLEVYAPNVKAAGLYRKLGFVEEGRLRRTYFYKGEYYDQLIMSMLAEEFREKHREFIEYLYSEH